MIKRDKNGERLSVIAKREYNAASYQRRKARRKVHKYETVRAKDYLLQREFGITLADYKNMLVQQNNACAICGKINGTDSHGVGKTRQLAVDHNHDTGVVRGLLCRNCNHAIGLLRDSPELVQKALRYLEQQRSSFIHTVDTDALLGELLNQ